MLALMLLSNMLVTGRNENNIKLSQTSGADTGKKVAVVGGCPAGLDGCLLPQRKKVHAVTII